MDLFIALVSLKIPSNVEIVITKCPNEKSKLQSIGMSKCLCICVWSTSNAPFPVWRFADTVFARARTQHVIKVNVYRYKCFWSYYSKMLYRYKCAT
jgi:hypothetical protein